MRVLDYDVNPINEHIGITVKYDHYKTGKTITTISFTFKREQMIVSLDRANHDSFYNMTNSSISTKLVTLSELINENISEFAAIITSKLRAQKNKQARYNSLWS